MEKTTLTLYVSKDVVNEFKEMQKLLKDHGIKITISDIVQETLKQYLILFEPIIKSLKEGKEVSHSEVYSLLSKMFSLVSSQLNDMGNKDD